MLAMSILMLTALLQAAPRTPSPITPVAADTATRFFSGQWTANLSKSKLHANSPIRTSSLGFVVTAETVSVTDHGTDAAGREIGTGTTTFRTDGQSHLHDELMPGLKVVAKWLSPRMLDTVLARPNGVVDHVTYEVSEDGQTLTLKTVGALGEQLIVFERSG